MPTAGRLAGAIAFALYGWYIATVMLPFFPERGVPSYLIPMCTAVGLICGWKVVGGRLGHGYVASVGHGLTGAFAFSFWVLFIISFVDMIDNSLRNRYDGPVEAITDIFALMAELAVEMLQMPLIVSIVVGGIVCALASEYFAKRYP